MKLIASIITLSLSAVFIQLFCLLAKNTKLLDTPNERTLHVKPTVRGAGIVFITVWLVSILFVAYSTYTNGLELLLLISSVLILALVSFVDDLVNLSVKSRLLIQCLVSLVVALYLSPISLNFIGFTLVNPLITLAVVFFGIIWAINLFNFMDGLDGFSAMQAIFLLLAYSLIFNQNNAVFYEYCCLLLAASVAGFLIFNFPPAKVFMGDVGSASLGLITIIMGLFAQKYYDVPMLYWLMLNGLFLFDASITLIRRILNREAWYAPHKKHAYQRLKQLNLNSATILSGQLIINLIIAMLVMILHTSPQYNLIMVSIELILLTGVYLSIEYFYPMHAVKLNHSFR